jgi:alkylation response protein AidB-like acyl-CoA dehydrogenase
MDFDLTDDQREIKRTARDLLAARSGWEAVRAAAEAGSPDDRLWAQLRELGWPGIAVAEEHGGQGLGAVELAVLAEEHGYACATTPFLQTAAVAAAIQAAGSADQRARWLPGLAAGEETAAVGRRDLLAGAADAAVVVLLDGDSAEVLDGAAAGLEPLGTIDSTRAYARVTGDADGEPLAAGADRIVAALAAEVVGLSQRALDMTVEYVKDRKQFGVPVGSFQAVSHRCAQMLLDTEGARSTAYFAAWAADADPDRLGEAAALAGAAAAGGVRDVTGSAIQAHGGIGFTWEADVHWLYKRAQLDAALLGGAGRHRAALTRIAARRMAQPAAT